MRRRGRAFWTTLAVLGAAGAMPPMASAAPARGAAIVRPPSTAGDGASGVGVHSSAYSDDGVLPYGNAAFLGSPRNVGPLSSPVVAITPTPTGAGYWLGAADGGIFSYGDARFYGSAGSLPLQAPVVGMAGTTDGHGYWSVALDGGIFTYGDATFYGSLGDLRLNEPIVGMAATPTGRGYWLVAADGGMFSFGDAIFQGSTGSLKLNSPIVGMAATPSGQGYWLVAADGGIFNFGDASFLGSTGNQALQASISGMARTPDGNGYWLAGSDGSVFAFGDAVGMGDNRAASPTQPIGGIAATPSANGYWLLEPDAFPVGFSHPGGGGAIVAAAAGQVKGNPSQSQGLFCNPYGPCEPWCALFAAWAWEQGGIPIPRYAFTGDFFTWSAARDGVHPASLTARPGEAVLYGSGPQSVNSSVHMGIVAQVWPDGAVVTIEGDSGPGPYGKYNVVINGPFLPSHSATYNGVGIYAVARP